MHQDGPKGQVHIWHPCIAPGRTKRTRFISCTPTLHQGVSKGVQKVHFIILQHCIAPGRTKRTRFISCTTALHQGASYQGGPTVWIKRCIIDVYPGLAMNTYINCILNTGNHDWILNKMHCKNYNMLWIYYTVYKIMRIFCTCIMFNSFNWSPQIVSNIFQISNFIHS